MWPEKVSHATMGRWQGPYRWPSFWNVCVLRREFKSHQLVWQPHDELDETLDQVQDGYLKVFQKNHRAIHPNPHPTKRGLVHTAWWIECHHDGNLNWSDLRPASRVVVRSTPLPKNPPSRGPPQCISGGGRCLKPACPLKMRYGG